MKKIFTLALAAAAVVGASAGVNKFEKVNSQMKVTESANLVPVKTLKQNVVSRAESMPELKTGEFDGIFAFNYTQDGIYSVGPVAANIIKEGDTYMMQLGFGEIFQDMELLPVPLTKVSIPMQDGSSKEMWGIPIDGTAVVEKDADLTDKDGNSFKADIFVAGCCVADGDGQYVMKGWGPAEVAFSVSEDGALLEQLQWGWNGLSQYAITGIAFGCKVNGDVVGVGMNFLSPVFYQPNGTFSMTAETDEGNEDISGGCYVTPFSNQNVGSGYLAYGVAGAGGALPSVIDGDEAKTVPNPAVYMGGYELYWGDSLSSDNFSATGTYAENGDAKTISYPDLNWLMGNGSDVAYFKDTTITFGGTGAINDVAVDNNNAPVEYFNLQGVRVNEPVAGQIVIRRQGNEVSKLLVK